jgi:hypothetical protein
MMEESNNHKSTHEKYDAYIEKRAVTNACTSEQTLISPDMKRKEAMKSK